MSEYGQITAQVRTGHGKGVARQLRRKGLIPAVMYGQGGPNLSLVVDPHLLNKATDPERRYNTLFQITVEQDGGSEVVPCLITDIQTDAIRDDILHVDFLRVDVEVEVERKIPVRYFGKAPGVAKGGRLKTFRRIVRVSAKPADFPVELEVDVTPLDVGDFLRVSDVSVPNATINERPDTTLAFIDVPKAATEDEEEEGAEGEAKDEKAKDEKAKD